MNIPDTLIFSTITSIVIFFLGFIIRERIIIFSKNKIIKNSNGFIEWNLTNILDVLPKQIESYAILNSSIKSEHYRNWNIEPSLRIKPLIEKEEQIHRILFERKKGNLIFKNEIFKNIMEHSVLIDLVLTETDKLFERKNQEILNYEKKLDNITTKLFQMITKTRKKFPKNKLEEEILAICFNFQKTKNKKREDIYIELTSKIENLIIDNKQNCDDCDDYIELTSEYYKELVYYQATLNQFADKINEYKNTLEYSSKILKINIEKYEKMKFKNNWI